MLRKRNAAFSLIALAALGALPAAAHAGCVSEDNNQDFRNTCVGWEALAVSSGTMNAAFGARALGSNTSGWANTAVGSSALYSNRAGIANTAIGSGALSMNANATGNTATGANALMSNTAGASNTANGSDSLQRNTTGRENSAFGSSALFSNTTGSFNTASGYSAMISSTTGSFNTASGYQALFLNETGGNNTAQGYGALASNATGSLNTAVGSLALSASKAGSGNVAVGRYAGGLQMGNNNTSIGREAAYNSTISATQTGSSNIALGYQAGSAWTSGSNNIAIGTSGTASDNGTIRIGTPGRQSRVMISGVYGTRISTGGAVVVDANGQLGTILSSRRYKQDIAPMGDASDALMRLRAVTFRYKQPDDDGSRPLQYGLIAEEVAEVMPDLVVRNADGSPETVAYHVLPSLLLNEYQKQHAELAETRAKLAAMEQEMAALRAAVNRLSAGPQPAAYVAP